jgi:hypothetical protein
MDGGISRATVRLPGRFGPSQPLVIGVRHHRCAVVEGEPAALSTDLYRMDLDHPTRVSSFIVNLVVDSKLSHC